jgi:hypothetical protein
MSRKITLLVSPLSGVVLVVLYKEELSNGLDQLHDGLCVIVPQLSFSQAQIGLKFPYGEGALRG